MLNPKNISRELTTNILKTEKYPFFRKLYFKNLASIFIKDYENDNIFKFIYDSSLFHSHPPQIKVYSFYHNTAGKLKKKGKTCYF